MGGREGVGSDTENATMILLWVEVLRWSSTVGSSHNAQFSSNAFGTGFSRTFTREGLSRAILPTSWTFRCYSTLHSQHFTATP